MGAAPPVRELSEFQDQLIVNVAGRVAFDNGFDNWREDIIQDVRIDVGLYKWPEWETLTDGVVINIARQRAIDAIRRINNGRSKRRRLFAPIPTDTHADMAALTLEDPTAAVDLRLELEDVYRKMDLLGGHRKSEQQDKAIVAALAMGYTMREIGDALGKHEATISLRVTRIRRQVAAA